MIKLMLDESRKNRSKYESICSRMKLTHTEKLHIIVSLQDDQLVSKSPEIIERYLNHEYPDNPNAINCLTKVQIDELFNKLCKVAPEEVEEMINELIFSYAN